MILKCHKEDLLAGNIACQEDLTEETARFVIANCDHGSSLRRVVVGGNPDWEFS